VELGTFEADQDRDRQQVQTIALHLKLSGVPRLIDGPD